MEMDSAFAYRVRKLRKEKGISQEELAEALNTTKGTVSIWERGVRMPEQGTVQKVASYFEVSVAYILGFTDVISVPLPSSQEESNRQIAKIELVEDLAKKLVQMSPETLAIMKASINEGYKQDSERGILESIDRYYVEINSSVIHEANKEFEALDSLENCDKSDTK